MDARREPDALDAARVVALVLLGVAAIGALGKMGLPLGLRSVLLQASFFTLPFAYARAAGLRPLADAGYGAPRLRDLALTVVASMASLWLLKTLADLQIDLFSAFGGEEIVREETRKIERTVERAERAVGFAGLSLFAIFPPLCEETLFRGITLRGFAKDFGPGRALLYTALLFAAMHNNVAQLLLMTFLGLYFGALAWLTGSVWPPILAHAINNAAVLLLQVKFGPQAQGFRASAPLLVLSLLVFGGVLAVMALDRRSRAIRASAGLS
ncbi:MAG TPA: CPBP family intramembrane glutamic endopeptidase [Planctomycetota bacterium]